MENLVSQEISTSDFFSVSIVFVFSNFTSITRMPKDVAIKVSETKQERNIEEKSTLALSVTYLVATLAELKIVVIFCVKAIHIFEYVSKNDNFSNNFS